MTLQYGCIKWKTYKIKGDIFCTTQQYSRGAAEYTIIIHDDIKKQIKEALNGLKHLEITNFESRQHLWPLKNMFCQAIKLNNLIIVLQYSCTQLLPWILLDQSMKFQKNTYCILKSLGDTWNFIADMLLWKNRFDRVP